MNIKIDQTDREEVSVWFYDKYMTHTLVKERASYDDYQLAEKIIKNHTIRERDVDRLNFETTQVESRKIWSNLVAKGFCEK